MDGHGDGPPWVVFGEVVDILAWVVKDRDGTGKRGGN